MKFKIDENLPPVVVEVFRARGHDAVTVEDQGMRGTSDPDLAKVCAAEGRVVVTMDKGFGYVVGFPPEEGSGIVVLRLGIPSVRAIAGAIERFLAVVREDEYAGNLIVVRDTVVRIHGKAE